MYECDNSRRGREREDTDEAAPAAQIQEKESIVCWDTPASLPCLLQGASMIAIEGASGRKGFARFGTT